MVFNSETHSWPRYRDLKTVECSALNEYIEIEIESAHFLPKLGITMGARMSESQRWWLTTRRHCSSSRHSRVCLHKNEEVVTAGTAQAS